MQQSAQKTSQHNKRTNIVIIRHFGKENNTNLAAKFFAERTRDKKL